MADAADVAAPRWEFALGDYWVPSRTPRADENLLTAVETLALQFRKTSWPVEQVLAAWRALGDGEGSVNLTAVTIRRRGPVAEIRDKYQQFQHVRVPAGEIEAVLIALVSAIRHAFEREQDPQ